MKRHIVVPWMVEEPRSMRTTVWLAGPANLLDSQVPHGHVKTVSDGIVN